MQQIDLMIRNIAIGLAILFIFPIAVDVSIDIINPRPQENQFKSTVESKSNEEPTLDREAYDAALAKYRKIYFYISVILGLIAMALGAFIQIPFIGLGFILGGTISLTVGYVAYWGMLNNVLRLISLLLALVLLVFSAYWQSRKRA